ncbi:hypothetical protein BH10PSE19_BH10PSE19_11240 [soil metagenome]
MSRLLLTVDFASKLDADLQFRQLQDGLKTLGRRIISCQDIETSSPEKSQGSSAGETPFPGSFNMLPDGKLLSPTALIRASSSSSIGSLGSTPGDFLVVSLAYEPGSHEPAQSTPATPLLHSVTMVQDEWLSLYYNAVSSFIGSSHAYSELVDLFLGPETYWVSQQHKLASQETEEANQRVQDERDFYGRMHKTVAQFETKIHNTHILSKYEEAVINPDLKRVVECALVSATGKPLNVKQQRELKESQDRIADYEAVRNKHGAASFSYDGSHVSLYHRIMDQTFKEEKESKQTSKNLRYQIQIDSYASHVAHRPARTLLLEPALLLELRMQLENDVGQENLLSQLHVAYGNKLEKAIQHMKKARTSELTLDKLREYKYTLPMLVHRDYLASLFKDFFTPSEGRASLFTSFLAQGELLSFKRALKEKHTQLSAQVTKAETAQEALDLRYGDNLAQATHNYRRLVKQLINGCYKDRIKHYLVPVISVSSLGSLVTVTPQSSADRFCEQILSTAVHLLPLRRIKDPATGNGLLHLVAKAYPSAGDTAKGELRKIFESLLKRGCDLLATNKAGLTPFAYANSFLSGAPDKALPDWELLKIAFRNHPTYNIGQRKIKEVVLKYFNTREGFFRRLLPYWYANHNSTATRRTQTHMMLEALVNAANAMTDDPLSKKIKEIEDMKGPSGELLKGLLTAREYLQQQLILHPDLESKGSGDEKRDHSGIGAEASAVSRVPMSSPVASGGGAGITVAAVHAEGKEALEDPEEAATKARLAQEKAEERRLREQAQRGREFEAKRAEASDHRAEEAVRRSRELEAMVAQLLAVQSAMPLASLVTGAGTPSSSSFALITASTAGLPLPSGEATASSSSSAPSPSLPTMTPMPLPQSPSSERAFAAPAPSTPGSLPPLTGVFAPAPTARIEETPVSVVRTDSALTLA